MSQPSVPAAVPKEVMDAFWKLGDTKDPIRLAAAQKIVAHAQSLKLSAAQPVDQRQDYVLGRLVKGLGSHSRRGFYVALHEILKNTGSEGVARVKQLMKQHLAVKGSKSVHIGFHIKRSFGLWILKGVLFRRVTRIVPSDSIESVRRGHCGKTRRQNS
ncbi:hypothetical protein TCAL_17314 [Tigriopus californicus]|uniref:Uncharacterized protein n=1 Tax=Tigriopus californicus TaxID=6832 RepID=A0A553NYC5_TIGCA|nr:hypothetical protein TCAL_17314 [Tigriopus californicus]